MIGEPQKRISPMALKVWKIYGVLESLIVAALAVGAIVLTYIFDWSHWVTVIAVGVVILFTYLFVFLLPTIKWKRWRYEVREQEIELQRGILIVKRTLVPMVRVQHVDTVQGPILKKYGLSTITISTAANVHEIPALDMEEADELRNSISQLARVAEDDV
ncbi:PH domain-containing protein [Rossellomorea vietnamensis]|uniref:PH domain-containing protein n=1 Tax=Rossellomorea vietnamensis TaxID=218284 RepID=A0ACD4C2F4_9BACI|nr:PH domain-containing protein [Rossellomorea vietnamensis]UXH42698.1 PH domain-containing protein [Rossellomorea vietnamensis]WQI94179.1 PH domain-containing protein [Rossellomorea vietnamensis]